MRSNGAGLEQVKRTPVNDKDDTRATGSQPAAVTSSQAAITSAQLVRDRVKPVMTTTAADLPCRPVSLFTLPLQQQQCSKIIVAASSSSSRQLTPGTLLEMSGGNTSKKLTTLSPDTIEHVFASDALISDMKASKPPTANAKATNPVSPPEKMQQLCSYQPQQASAAQQQPGEFSPSDFLRSPHFTNRSRSLHDQISGHGMMLASAPSPAGCGMEVGPPATPSPAAALMSFDPPVAAATAVDSGQGQQQEQQPVGSDELLADWLDMSSDCLPTLEMEALQRELELGSPMSIDGIL